MNKGLHAVEPYDEMPFMGNLLLNRSLTHAIHARHADRSLGGT